jgi:hypothetical protein
MEENVNIPVSPEDVEISWDEEPEIPPAGSCKPKQESKGPTKADETVDRLNEMKAKFDAINKEMAAKGQGNGQGDGPNEKPKKDDCGQIKCFCPKCGYAISTEKKWIENSGPPLCPSCRNDNPKSMAFTWPIPMVIDGATDNEVTVDVKTYDAKNP